MTRPLLLVVTVLWACQLSRGEATIQWRPLYERFDTELQQVLTRRLREVAAWSELIDRRKLAVGLVDLTGETPRFAAVNGDHMMYAASLPKIAIMLTTYMSFEDGSLAETAEIHKELKDMIQVSSNGAATRLMDIVGMRKIERVMRDPRYTFYDDTRFGGLWVGKRYAASGERRGDPLFDISHGATVAQICRFFDFLVHGALINAERSAQMLADLAEPGIHHKFVAALEQRAPAAQLYRKSGTWRNWHSDAILVKGPVWRHYILAALVEDPNGEKMLRELVPVIETALKETVPWQIRLLDDASREAVFQERLPTKGGGV